MLSSQIPHLRLHERAFVLRPLCDMDPTLVHPTMNCTVLDLLNALPESDRYPLHWVIISSVLHLAYSSTAQLIRSSMQRVVPIGRCSKGKSLLVDFGTRTYVCGVLNVTPDRWNGVRHIYLIRFKTITPNAISRLIRFRNWTDNYALQ